MAARFVCRLALKCWKTWRQLPLLPYSLLHHCLSIIPSKHCNTIDCTMHSWSLLHPVHDYSLQSSSLVFLNTERMVERSTVVVRIREDSTPEQDPPTESFRLVLSSNAGGGMQPAVVFSVPEMEVHIRDNDYWVVKDVQLERTETLLFLQIHTCTLQYRFA